VRKARASACIQFPSGLLNSNVVATPSLSTADSQNVDAATDQQQLNALRQRRLQPANDACPDAIELVVPDNVAGTTELAAGDDSVACCLGYEDCAGNVDVWYTVVGTGNEMVAFTCSPSDSVRPDVYTGPCGAGMQCKRQVWSGGSYIDLSSCDGQYSNIANWVSTDGETHYVRVRSVGETPFDLTVQEYLGPPLPDNYRCEDATTIASGDALDGYTSPDGNPLLFTSPSCGWTTQGGTGTYSIMMCCGL